MGDQAQQNNEQKLQDDKMEEDDGPSNLPIHQEADPPIEPLTPPPQPLPQHQPSQPFNEFEDDYYTQQLADATTSINRTIDTKFNSLVQNQSRLEKAQVSTHTLLVAQNELLAKFARKLDSIVKHTKPKALEPTSVSAPTTPSSSSSMSNLSVITQAILPSDNPSTSRDVASPSTSHLHRTFPSRRDRSPLRSRGHPYSRNPHNPGPKCCFCRSPNHLSRECRMVTSIASRQAIIRNEDRCPACFRPLSQRGHNPRCHPDQCGRGCQDANGAIIHHSDWECPLNPANDP
ncbi:hypothetical protein PFISCL1PPCAC_4432 [Pristionchus fissidentatus]|uniref:CCHC-type domain-containing protein n=1 Tax=Pristionchus fissidentatus TaxID=1538716 RepID=A0AAV5V3S3_9BILA|nr:hypothetical protein PFISCL1PPCAC_4432 [Pristionchus fissidentatus]